MKVALVCDWLTNVGGAEKVLLEIHRLYPKAPIYTSKYDPKGIDWFLDADVRTGWLQKFPTKMRRVLGPFRQRYFSHLDLSEYDLIISVTGAEAKSVKSGKWLHEHKKKSKNPKGIHISYCHVPTQYYWQMYDDYVKNPGFSVLNPLVRFFFKLLVKPLRSADFKAAQRVDHFVTISEYAKDAIRQYYGRDSVVIHPPVEVDVFARQALSVFRGRGSSRPSTEVVHQSSSRKEKQASLSLDSSDGLLRGSDPSSLGRNLRKPLNDTKCLPGDYYITTSRQVNWKRIDIAIDACMMIQRKLMVVGEGPEHKKLVKMAKGINLIEFVPLVEKKKLAELLAGAKGYLFPSLEPFGIAPVEALAAGCPVVAYGKGGACDYVKDGKNGLLFDEQTAKSMAEAILKFEKMKFDRKKVSESVKDYTLKRFDKEVKDFVNEKTD